MACSWPGKESPRHHLATLKAYLKLVEHEVAKSTAVISHAGQLTPDIISNIKSQMEGKYGRKLDTVERDDPALIAGARSRRLRCLRCFHSKRLIHAKILP